MDFMSRNGRPNQAPAGVPAVGSAPESQHHHGKAPKESKEQSKLIRFASAALLFGVVILAVAVIFSMVFSSAKKESEYINKDQYQAIFLSGGQVYFGKITRMTDSYLTLQDIYYLQVRNQVQQGSNQTNPDISLAKLGNELHGPEDVMIVNKTEVQFWENLKADGQVVKAIKDYQANPNAAQQQQQTQQDSTATDSSTGAETSETTNPTE